MVATVSKEISKVKVYSYIENRV